MGEKLPAHESPRDLVPNCYRLYEVLSRKRPLTLATVRRLHEGLGIPAESLLRAQQEEAA